MPTSRTVNPVITAIHVGGARPNFMKLAPVHKAMKVAGMESLFLHTGQHYDESMSRVFLDQFGLGTPDFELKVGSGSHAEMTARVMIHLESILLDIEPDIVLVYGDVNSSIAAALTAAKLRIPVGHVEAGLRSFDRSMPEEINRLLTDCISDLLFTPSQDAVDNLTSEGIPPGKIFSVGNVMIDSLLSFLQEARGSGIHNDLGLTPGEYIVATIHRPSNVDEELTLKRTMRTLVDASRILPIVMPVHPRTRARLEDAQDFDLSEDRLRFLDPMAYVDFLALLDEAAAVLTDSGGIQEETTVLGIPCLTMRNNTERPVTVTHGTNRVVGTEPEVVIKALHAAVGTAKRPCRPPLWDGQASDRIVDVLRTVVPEMSRL